jgi:hypothetical protein
MKKCNKCEEEKELTEFNKARSIDGFTKICKECKIKNRNVLKTCQKCEIEKKLSEFKKSGHTVDSRTNICKKCSRFNNKIGKCFICKSESEMAYKIYNKDGNRVISYTNTCIGCYQIKELERGRIKGKKYYNNRNDKNILRDKERKRKYRENNIEKIRKYHKENYKNYTPLQRLRLSISNNIRMSFKNKGYKKKSKAADILGCSIKDFKKYLESKFESWMSWENRGLYNGELDYGWDIDHIIPLCTVETEEDIVRLNHYTNLQPLCSYKNRVVKRDLLEYLI